MKNAELIIYLDRKFAAIDQRFDALDDKFATKDELAMGLLELENKLETRMDKMDERFDGLYNLIDGTMAELKTYRQEQIMTNGRLDRHERWHHEVADKLGMKLKS